MSHLIAIVGRPNTGKSTLFNRLIGERRAILSNVAGTTRDVLFGDVDWNGTTFTIADTAGIEANQNSVIAKSILLQTKVALKSADLIMLMVDAKTGLNPQDVEAANLIRKFGKPVILLINKTDSKSAEANTTDFLKLGFPHTFAISGLSGRGVGDMLDVLVKQLKKIKLPKTGTRKKDTETIRVAVLGRPNVGKSTLFNKLVGKERSLVSSTAGTTRDAINQSIPYQDKTIEFIDTAGLRRRGKVEVGIEKVSALYVLRSIQNADICLLLMEGHEGVLAQDMHVMQMILDNYKSPILIVNKWDLVEKTASITAEFEKYLEQKYRFAPWVPRLYVSALTGQRVDRIKDLILQVWQARNLKISSKDLNRTILKAVRELPPKGRRESPKIYFVRQVGVNPPVIQLKTNHPEDVHFTYLRYLDKQLRNLWDFVGTPIRFVLIKSSTK